MDNKRSFSEELGSLTSSQRGWLLSFVQQFKKPHEFKRNTESDLVSDTVLENIGDLLRIHHAMSRRALSKAPFEYAFEKALQLSGMPAKLADSTTNPGYDLKIGDVRISLKTEASKDIKEQQIHVSKWLEMGKGEWNPPTIQLPRFLEHMTGYDRILTLRCLLQTGAQYLYELVEIPKSLMLEATSGVMEKAAKTKQETSPWYCRVLDVEATELARTKHLAKKGKNGKAPKPVYKFSLYFDAGSERKLQVKGLMKNLCTVHATWKFDSVQLTVTELE
jgi:hypothetical protein